jgi:hypothetical protein
MHCIYCNKSHRSLLEPDGGDSCDAFAQPALAALPINMKVIEAFASRK